MTSRSTCGKLVLRYVGEQYGCRHTELWINDKMVTADYKCDTSIMLMLWCAHDAAGTTLELNPQFNYEHNDYCDYLCRRIFKPTLFSKYDPLYTNMATANAYKFFVYKKKYTVNAMLSARKDLFLHVQKKFKIDNLEVEYDLFEDEIWTRRAV